MRTLVVKVISVWFVSFPKYFKFLLHYRDIWNHSPHREIPVRGMCCGLSVGNSSLKGVRVVIRLGINVICKVKHKTDLDHIVIQ